MNDDELARRIDEAVAAVEGVADVYSARPVIARLWRQAVDDTAPRTAVGADGAGSSIGVSIGVSGREDAAATARRVVAAVRAVLGEPEAQVTVRVSRIVPDAVAPTAPAPHIG